MRPALQRGAKMAGLAAASLAGLVAAPVAMAASPSPSRPPSTDTRSVLEGPGFVGSPELAILGVLAIGLAALLLTLAYIRLTGPREPRAR
jgi:multisubunit Na+/H+ antiporter MnhB subunit